MSRRPYLPEPRPAFVLEPDDPEPVPLEALRVARDLCREFRTSPRQFRRRTPKRSRGAYYPASDIVAFDPDRTDSDGMGGDDGTTQPFCMNCFTRPDIRVGSAARRPVITRPMATRARRASSSSRRDRPAGDRVRHRSHRVARGLRGAPSGSAGGEGGRGLDYWVVRGSAGSDKRLTRRRNASVHQQSNATPDWDCRFAGRARGGHPLHPRCGDRGGGPRLQPEAAQAAPDTAKHCFRDLPDVPFTGLTRLG
jgi:hypothetical protein